MTDTVLAGPPVLTSTSGRGYATAFWGLVVRDLVVLRRQGAMFVARTVMQPFLIAFVFAYVFPRIGQSFGGDAAAESGYGTILLPGLIAFTTMFQGVSSVALPLVDEFNTSHEIEDRAMAPRAYELPRTAEDRVRRVPGPARRGRRLPVRVARRRATSPRCT